MRNPGEGNGRTKEASNLRATGAPMTLAMPLSATVTSVGMLVAPPLPPARPSSWATSPATAPGGAAAPHADYVAVLVMLRHSRLGTFRRTIDASAQHNVVTASGRLRDAP